MTGLSVPRRFAVSAAAVLIAVATMVAALRYGGGVVVFPGDPALTQWLLGGARLGYQIAAVATVGLLLAAAVLAPRDRGRLSGAAYRFQRTATWPALAWAVFSTLVLCLTLADVSGVGADRIITPGGIAHFIATFPIGRAFALSALLAVVIAVVCRAATSVTGMLPAGVLAIVAVLPPLFTGHAAAGGNHQVAVSAMILHVVPVTLWAGGLLALLLIGLTGTDTMAVAAGRFSVLAGWCVAAVAVSGLVSAAIRVPEPLSVLTSPYGQLMLLKAAVLAGLGALGWYQRRRALPALRAGDRRRFARVAGTELVLFGVAMGAASALSRTPPPLPEGYQGPDETPAQALLGYSMPPPVTAGRLLTDWLPEPLFLLAAAVAAVLYLAGVRRLRRGGDRWPTARTVAFVAGCALLAVVTSSGVARYAPVAPAVHIGQYLVLATVIPFLLVLGSPLGLVRPAADPAWPGPYEWLHIVRVRVRPAITLAMTAAIPWAWYFTGLYELTLRSHAAHLMAVISVLVSGCLFARVVLRTRRAALVLAAMVAQALLGIALTVTDRLPAADWFSDLGLTGTAGLIADVNHGGMLVWTAGQLPLLLVLLGLWRHRRRVGRPADATGTPAREPTTSAA